MRKNEAAYGRRIVYFDFPEELKIAPDEVFVDIPQSQIPGIYDYYQISNYGRVYNKYTRNILIQQTGTDGYYTVGLSGTFGAKPFRINRLVMMGFYPIDHPEKYDVNHKDCNPNNNHLSNLEWATRSQNIQHAYDNGLMKKGEDGPTAKITNETAHEICGYIEAGFKYTEIVEMLPNRNVTYGIVQNIGRGRDWKDISSQYNFPSKRKGVAFTNEQIETVCQYFENNPKPALIPLAEYCRKAMKYCNIPCDRERDVENMIAVYRRVNYTRISSKYNF